MPGGEKQPVTNSNRRKFVQAYIRYLLDTSVSRQYEPFKRGFFTVCGGNALSLFRPEEIELLVRGSDEALDIDSLRAVAVYEGWPCQLSAAPQEKQVKWFWETFEAANPTNQRKLLAFITGSDRIPAMGATNLVIKIQLLNTGESRGGGRRSAKARYGLRLPQKAKGKRRRNQAEGDSPDEEAAQQEGEDGEEDEEEEEGEDCDRFPTARTCFNTLVLHPYRRKKQLEQKLWTAVHESEGFGLK